jgi:hypothetical protein
VEFAGRVRRPGGGRKRRRDLDPGLVPTLEALVDPDTRGDPESPLRWTSKSTRELAEALGAAGHPVSDDTVGRLLGEQGYTLQRTRKTWKAPSIPIVTPSSATQRAGQGAAGCGGAGGQRRLQEKGVGRTVRQWRCGGAADGVAGAGAGA